MSRPGVDESSKWDFIKIILTKDQEKNKRNKKGVRIRKSRYIKLDGTYCYIEKFNITLSLCEVLRLLSIFPRVS